MTDSEQVYPNLIHLNSPQDCLTVIQCNPPSIDCCLGKCDQCGDVEEFKSNLKSAFDEAAIEKVSYKMWTTTDRSTLEDRKEDVDDFTETFGEKFIKYQQHSFIARMQSLHYKQSKENLSEGEVLVICDFSENYSFVIQDEIQSFHWNNDQVTIHPFVAYYVQDNNILHISYVAISECNEHDVIAVHLFQKMFLQHLMEKVPNTNKIIYFSDGCAGQYKNCKSFLNLCYHKDDFGIDAEWNFFATSHGKGPSDGVGGTVKRLVSRASLQRPLSDQILSVDAFFDFCSKKIENIAFGLATKQDYLHEANLLKERLQQAETITGTRKLHQITPISHTEIAVKLFSLDTKSEVKKVVKTKHDQIKMDDIHGYVTVMYDGKWWLGYILEKDFDEATVKFLHPHGPSPSFTYPRREDILLVSLKDILSKVNVKTVNGRTYTITKSEENQASDMLILKS